LGTPAGASRAWMATVTPELFRVLGVRAQLGRGFTADDDRPGTPPVVVLSDSLWRDAYGADPNVVGRWMSVDAVDVTVIGVMPRTVALVTPGAAAWMPID